MVLRLLNPLFYISFIEKPYTFSVNEKTNKQIKTKTEITQLRYFIG